MRLGPEGWLNVLVACFELGRARWHLTRIDLSGFRQAATSAESPPRSLNPADATKIERISHAISRGCRVVPWRADCLVQATAAQHWLARKGLAASIHLGARKSAVGNLDAHAWLICNGQIVTGGDIRGFETFR